MPQPTKRKLLLVGWDSADWKIIQPLIDSGAMPGIARIVEEGASGNLTTLEPQLSPMLWTSIATGKMAYHHGVPGFTEVDPGTGRVVPVSAATRKCRTLWEMLGDRGLRSHVISWFASHGERDLDGCMVSNMFGHLPNAQPDSDPAEWPPPPPGTYWPESLAAAMNDLRVSPHDLDPDEVLRLFVPEAHTIDQEKDKRLWMLAGKLAEAFSVHEAVTHVMTADPDWNLCAVYYRTIDEISHLFMPYHPPRMAGIPEADFELYRHVVIGIYRLHDMFLQRLVQLAGPDAAVMVVSDHGFHSDHLRPKFTPRVPAGITVWHRPQGVFAAAGPGFKRDELVFGARLLDVAPTILHFFGLPVGADMESLQRLLDADAAADMLARENSGFSVDASVRITLIDRDVPSYFQSLEHLLRYCARPPFARERLSVIRGEDGRIARVRYVLPRHKAANWLGPGRGRKSTLPDASGVVELSPFEFLDRLADLVPPPRKHRRRYQGVFAPNHKLRRAVTAHD